MKRTCLIAPYFLPLSVSMCCSGSKRKYLFTTVTMPYKHIEYISCIPSLPLSPCKSRSLTSYRCFKVKAGADRVVKAPCSNTAALCSRGKSLRGGYQLRPTTDLVLILLNHQYLQTPCWLVNGRERGGLFLVILSPGKHHTMSKAFPIGAVI